jgi:hypothetical protein
LGRRVTLTLSDFAAEVLREQARAHALSPEEFVDRAARYYVTERSTGRPARKIPAFLEPSSDGREAGLQFDLDKAAWEDLEAVAKSEETSVERLLEHAVLLLIADLDSGRVATRFVEGPGDRPHDDGEWS